MSQSIGQNIKRLRKERNLTQEELAEQLNVTSQAVSKWENETGMPDISQIVPLASYFNVPTDALFGLNPDGVEKAIKEAEKIESLPDMDNDKCIELWMDLLRQYPRNNIIRRNLARVYLRRKQAGDYTEAAKLYEKILDESTDTQLRIKTLGMLCFSYNRAGDTENAVRVAKLCGPAHISEDSLLAKVDGYEKRNEVNQKLLTYCVEESAWCILRQTYKTDEETLFAYRTALKMLDLLYYDGCKANISRVYIEIHRCLCRLLAGMKKDGELYAELEKWLDCVIYTDTLPLGKYNYTGNIFKKHTEYLHDEAVPAGQGLKFFLRQLDNPVYDYLRSTDRFTSFIENSKARYSNALKD